MAAAAAEEAEEAAHLQRSLAEGQEEEEEEDVVVEIEENWVDIAIPVMAPKRNPPLMMNHRRHDKRNCIPCLH